MVLPGQSANARTAHHARPGRQWLSKIVVAGPDALYRDFNPDGSTVETPASLAKPEKGCQNCRG